MDIWKCPREVTNERCKVKCPVKSSGDLKQAAFTASGRFPQTIISCTASPGLSVTTGQRRRAAHLQMFWVSQRQGRWSPVPWVAAEPPAHRLRVLQSDVSGALMPACSRQVLSSRGLIRDAGVQAVRQNHFGSDYCNQVRTCGRGSGDTCYIPLIRAQTAVSGQTERG